MATSVLDVLRHRLGAPQSASTARRAPARLRALLSACRKHHVVSACVLACLAHTPARAQTAYGLPSSERAQGFAAQIANRLGEWRQMIEASRFLADSEKIETVNRFFNRALLFANDREVWGSPDHWATPMEFMERGRGDCEDFAIAKYFVLRLLGFPAADLRIAVLTGVETNEVHAVLLARLAGEWQVLDNREELPRPLRRYTGWIPQYAVSESAGFRYTALENAAAAPYRPAQR